MGPQGYKEYLRFCFRCKKVFRTTAKGHRPICSDCNKRPDKNNTIVHRNAELELTANICGQKI